MQEATGQLRVESKLPERAAPSVYTQNFGKFERLGATYTHLIKVPRIGETKGHSKPMNQPEPDDKQKLLKDIVSRLARSSKGYLKPGNSIAFYHNRSNFDRDSVKLFTLFADRYEPDPHILTWHWLIQFLEFFYTPTTVSYVQDLSGNAPPVPQAAPSQVSTRQPSTQQKNTLSMNMRFNSMAELKQYTEALIADGHAVGQVGDWMVKMLEKHNF